MLKNHRWINKESNKQVGYSCGFYAMAFVYGMICGDGKFGRKAALAVIDSLAKGQSYVGEILSIHKLYEHWNQTFQKSVHEYGYNASIVNINSSSDFFKLLKDGNLVILPVVTSDGITPHYEVWYKASSELCCWEPAFGTVTKGYDIVTSYLLNHQIPCSFDFDSYRYSLTRELHVRNCIRNLPLTLYLLFYNKRARKLFSSQSCVEVNLSGHCLVLRKTPTVCNQ